MAWYKYNTSRTVDGVCIPGVYLPAIIHNSEHYLTLLGVYQDAVVECWDLCTLEEFESKVRNGWIVQSVPDNRTLRIHNLATLTVRSSLQHGSIEDLLKDVRSAIEELNGRMTAQEKFILAVKEYSESQSDLARDTLFAAHQDLPTFYHIYTFGSRFERYQEIQELLGIERPRPEDR